MAPGYRFLKSNHFLSTHVRLVKEWEKQDVVSFSQLVDFTEIERERQDRSGKALSKPSYTAFIVDSIARTLRRHPKVNRIVYRGLTGYRWAEFERVDVAVAVEVVEGDVDVAYASIIRDADQIGIDGIAAALEKLSVAPADDKQLSRLKRFPPIFAAALARGTGLHPKLWVRFRGGACAVTSPAKYGIEAVAAKTSWPLQFAFGRVKERCIAVDGACVARRSANLSLCWHRELATGAVVARFFEDIVQDMERKRVEEPV